MNIFEVTALQTVLTLLYFCGMFGLMAAGRKVVLEAGVSKK